MKMIQNATMFQDVVPMTTLQAGVGGMTVPRGSDKGAGFAQLLQGRQTSGEGAEEDAASKGSASEVAGKPVLFKVVPALAKGNNSQQTAHLQQALPTGKSGGAATETQPGATDAQLNADQADTQAAGDSQASKAANNGKQQANPTPAVPASVVLAKLKQGVSISAVSADRIAQQTTDQSATTTDAVQARSSQVRPVVAGERSVPAKAGSAADKGAEQSGALSQLTAQALTPVMQQAAQATVNAAVTAMASGVPQEASVTTTVAEQQGIGTVKPELSVAKAGEAATGRPELSGLVSRQSHEQQGVVFGQQASLRDSVATRSTDTRQQSGAVTTPVSGVTAEGLVSKPAGAANLQAVQAAPVQGAVQEVPAKQDLAGSPVAVDSRSADEKPQTVVTSAPVAQQGPVVQVETVRVEATVSPVVGNGQEVSRQASPQTGEQVQTPVAKQVSEMPSQQLSVTTVAQQQGATARSNMQPATAAGFVPRWGVYSQPAMQQVARQNSMGTGTAEVARRETPVPGETVLTAQTAQTVQAVPAQVLTTKPGPSLVENVQPEVLAAPVQGDVQQTKMQDPQTAQVLPTPTTATSGLADAFIHPAADARPSIVETAGNQQVVAELVGPAAAETLKQQASAVAQQTAQQTTVLEPVTKTVAGARQEVGAASAVRQGRVTADGFTPTPVRTVQVATPVTGAVQEASTDPGKVAVPAAVDAQPERAPSLAESVTVGMRHESDQAAVTGAATAAQAELSVPGEMAQTVPTADVTEPLTAAMVLGQVSVASQPVVPAAGLPEQSQVATAVQLAAGQPQQTPQGKAVEVPVAQRASDAQPAVGAASLEQNAVKAAGFIPTPVAGSSFQVAQSTPATAAVQDIPAVSQPVTARVASAEDTAKERTQEEAPRTSASSASAVPTQPASLGGAKVQVQTLTADLAQQPAEMIASQVADKGAQIVSDKKENQAAGVQKSAPEKSVVAEQTVATPKASVEEVLGTKTAVAVGTAKFVPSQGSSGQDGSGDTDKKGHAEQKAPDTGNVQSQTTWNGVQPQPATEAAQPETKSVTPKSALHESILSQVKDGVVSSDGKGGGQMSIRLNPGDLGELKIQVQMDSGNHLRVEVQAENPTVKNLLMSNLDSLKEALSNKNFNMEGFDVSTGGGGFNSPLPDDRRSSQQQAMLKPAKAMGYPGQDEGQVNYLTEDVNNLLDVRF